MSGTGPDLDELIAHQFGEARAEWPGVELEAKRFARYLRERLDDADDPEAYLASVTWSELYLACACSAGDDRALAAFDERYLAVVPGAIAGMGLSASDADDIAQRIREKLFVTDGEQGPRIDQYAGGGSLHGLVKVMAVREAISLLRKRTREVWSPDDELLRLPSVMADPELDNTKSQLRDHFRRAFEEAVDELSSRERNLLRMHLLEGVTLDQLGKTYSVHRVTITRWLARARHRLLAATRRRLAETAGADDLDGFFGMVESRLDLSLSRLLASKR